MGLAVLENLDQPSAAVVSAEGSRQDFFNFSREELAALLQERFGASSYRSTQLFQWVYRQGVRDLALMSNLAKEFRDDLKDFFHFPLPPIVDRQISSDGTRKYLFELEHGSNIESVMIKQPQRMTLCVSSQVGCGMACAFCRTGTMGFHRNLSTSEIVRQVLGVIEDAKNFDDMFQNIVFMGMGEPLHNYDGVVRAVKILTDPQGLAIPPRKITISSVGLVPAIKKFGESGVDANLAISLNATTDEVRSQIMPINKAYPIRVLLETLKGIPAKRRKKITMEYVMLAGVNDSDADMRRLPRLVEGLPVKINLIPYNENAGLGFKTPAVDQIHAWQDYLTQRGLNTTIRWSKGQDIDAACGQLAVNKVGERPKRRVAAQPSL
ncbi:MAG: 23S rRNA (adenine(2503)-C(2))-methyltransferase RlmN [Deltaproteobacteria bacterium]|nr:23S rRNA (adenine(2503)-C(2))-methyltransferase RlmN [Deltaproteobacteria bacterium]